MKEFVENLIGRLEEHVAYNEKMFEMFPNMGEVEKTIYNTQKNSYEETIRIVNQLAEEYKQCIKSSCSNCETYDKEKHYCPKWCDVIKGTVAEIEESHNNDFCEWQEISVGCITAVREPHGKKLLNHNIEQQFCQYCGKKIKIKPY